MLVPLSTDRPLGRNRVVTPFLVALNLGVFLLGMIMEQAEPERWESILRAGVLWRLDFHWHQLITYAFLHAGWMHVLGNMLFLWTFGGNIEDKLGRVWFLLFYLAGGAAAGAAHIAFSMYPVLGASGSVAACTGAYLVLFPRTHIRCFAFLIAVGVVSVPAWWFIGGSLVWDLFGGFGMSGNVAHGAHLGGFGFGFVVALVLRATKILTPEEWDLFTQFRHARRRAELRAAVEAAEKERTARIAPTAHTDAQQVAAAAVRTQIQTLLGQDKPEEAARAYAQYAAGFSGDQKPLPLARRQQLDVANQLFTMGEHRAAADAYEQFVDVYRNDTEEPNARVMLALVCVRYLKDGARARRALEGVAPRLRDAQHREMAATLEAELTAMATPASP